MDTKPYTLNEIQTQPEAWAEAVQVASDLAEEIKALWESDDFTQVIFTGCGSTYYLSLSGAATFQGFTNTAARAVPGGELLLYPQFAYADIGAILLVAISRSGTTTETIKALEAFQASGRGSSIVVTNYPNSPLAQLGDLVLGIPTGQERSVAQTRSFASMYVASTAISAIVAGKTELLAQMARLPEIGTCLLANYDPLARALGSNLKLDRFYFLGSGSRYGLACEVNLKMKEMTLTHSEPFHFLEFRHGPMSMVTGSAAVIGLLSEAQRTMEKAVLDEMSALGGQVLSLAEDSADIEFHSCLPEDLRGVLYLPILQLMAYYRAVAKDLDPDNPKNLTAVVELDL